LGVTPSASWFSGSRVFQFGATGALWTNGSNNSAFSHNAVFGDASTTYQVTGQAASYYRQLSGAHNWFTAPSGTAGNAITFTQAMSLTAGGTLLAGTTSDSGYHTFQKTTNSDWAAAVINAATSTPQGLLIRYSGASPNDTGNSFLIGLDSGVTTRFSFPSNGGLRNYQANDVNLSDRREKTNFALAGEYLPKICAIPVQTFNYIDQNHEEDPGLTLGVVAQDVQTVAPELVTESNWGTEEAPKMRLSIYQTDLQYALMKCIQEQQAIITALTARVEALESN
jgi:hypothetical protein